MKKLVALVAAVLLATSFSVEAQEDVKAGQFMIGGFGGLNLEEHDYRFSIAPYGEWLVIDRLGVGAQLAYSIGSPGHGAGADHRFGFGAFASYYIPVVPNFYFKPMLEMNLMFKNGTHFEVAAVPAFQYFAWERLSFLIKAGGVSFGDFRLDGYKFRFNIASEVALGLAYSF